MDIMSETPSNSGGLSPYRLSRPSRRAVLASISAPAVVGITAAHLPRPDDEIVSRLDAEGRAWVELTAALAEASRTEDALFEIDPVSGEFGMLEDRARRSRERADAAQDLHGRARAALYDTAPSTAAGAVALLERIVEREHDMQGAAPEVLAALAHVSALLGRVDVIAAASGLRGSSDRDLRRG